MTSDFEEFYHSEYPKVFRATYALSAHREAALDATQEAFKRAFAKWSRLRRESWAAGWVMTTALNICKKEAKKATRWAEYEAEVAPGPVPPASPDRLDLVSALRALPLRQRQAILLFYLCDLPVPVVSDLMNVAEGTVRAHLAQARAALRRALHQSKEDEEDELIQRTRELGKGP